MKHIVMTALLAFSMVGAARVGAAAPDGDMSEAKEILSKTDAYRNFRGKSFTFDLTLISHEEGEPEKSYKLKAEILNSHSSLVVYADPPSEQGKALLTDGKNLWFSTPNNSKPIRITPQQRLLGEASNGDVASTDFSGDYEPALAGQETVEGVPTIKLNLTAKPDSLAAYSRLELWVREKNAAPVKADFYGPSGKLLKTAYYRKFEALPNAGGKLQLTELEIVNALNSAKRTVMRFDHFKPGEIPASHFTTSYLSKLK